MQEWISVKDKLPESSGHYLACTKFNDMYVCDFEKSSRPQKRRWQVVCECCHAEDDQFSSDDVTHWMPLPDLPQK